MVQIAGTYELVENKNFAEFLTKLGIAEEKAQKANEAKSVLEVIVNGKKVSLKSDAQLKNNVSELVLDEEVDEQMPLGIVVKSSAKLVGDVLTIESKMPDGTLGGKRILTFTNTGLEMVMTVQKDGVPDAKRVYKRI